MGTCPWTLWTCLGHDQALLQESQISNCRKKQKGGGECLKGATNLHHKGSSLDSVAATLLKRVSSIWLPGLVHKWENQSHPNCNAYQYLRISPSLSFPAFKAKTIRTEELTRQLRAGYSPRRGLLFGSCIHIRQLRTVYNPSPRRSDLWWASSTPVVTCTNSYAHADD